MSINNDYEIESLKEGMERSLNVLHRELMEMNKNIVELSSKTHFLEGEINKIKKEL